MVEDTPIVRLRAYISRCYLRSALRPVLSSKIKDRRGVEKKKKKKKRKLRREVKDVQKPIRVIVQREVLLSSSLLGLSLPPSNFIQAEEDGYGRETLGS
ncbi:hypothetical protein M0804_004150 [Polistes exclamans]|nr:hypothetical protein M0804_004150 [Polistes exclamans]